MKRVLEVRPPGAASYPVLCGEDAPAALAGLWEPGWRQAVIIGDANTDALFGRALADALDGHARVLRLQFSGGEGGKTRASKESIEDAMIAGGVDRSACVVAVGGGVVLDLAGFVAATYQRGLPHVNVATTLLAQLDAAIGGKTGVNTEAGKNLIGAFHHPRAVLLDTAALGSLSAGELRNGLAELVKHAVLRDAALFAAIEAWAAQQQDLRPPDALIARSVAIKADVVAEDDRDRGMRQILNYGHTVAHALEHASGHALAHGQAVAVGMVVETRVAVAAGAFPAADLARLERLLAVLGLPTAPACDFATALPFLRRDKKNVGASVRCAIPSVIGVIAAADGDWTRAVEPASLERAWGGA